LRGLRPGIFDRDEHHIEASNGGLRKAWIARAAEPGK
jgi:hypothetical protein